jgi:acyl-CoA oxidase
VDNLLDRISQIDQDGNFKCVVDSEDKRFGLQLGSLSGGRYMIAMNGSIIAMQALTISLRYAAVRRQFAKNAKSPESLLIEYPLMKRRLIPLLAQAVIYLTGNMQAIYTWDQNYKNILDPTNKVIQELHAISSATKPKTGWFAT